MKRNLLSYTYKKLNLNTTINKYTFKLKELFTLKQDSSFFTFVMTNV